MNIDRIHERVRNIVVLAGGLLFAVFCGMLAGGGNFQKLGLIFAAFGTVAVCMVLREHLWILIPLCWGLNGKLVALPIPVSLRDLVVLVVFTGCFAFRALKVIRSRMSFTLLEGLVLANVLYVATMFVRNPVGAKAFGSQMVGGRPYWSIAISALACWVLATAPADRKFLMRVPFLFLIGAGLQASTEIVGYVAPGIALFLGDFYSGFMPILDTPAVVSGPEPAYVRWVPLGELGVLGVVALAAYFRPVTLFYMPFRLFALMTSMAGILVSGYRTAVLKATAAILFGTFFRRDRMRDFVIILCVGSLALVIVIAGNGRLFHLPLTAQRALSFLPGNWDADAVRDAKDSAQWRLDMWRMVLTEDKWIQNKWLGDGFGFTRHELGIMETSELGGPGFIGGAQQETFMIVGSFHNGPLSSIRYGGAVGLVLLLALLIVSARRALDLVRKSYGTPFFPVTLFLTIPIIYVPFEFVVIVGGYDSNVPVAIVSAGFISLMRRTFGEGIGAGALNANDAAPINSLPDLQKRPLSPSPSL